MTRATKGAPRELEQTVEAADAEHVEDRRKIDDYTEVANDLKTRAGSAGAPLPASIIVGVGALAALVGVLWIYWP